MNDRELMQQALEAAPLSDYSKADGDFYKWWYSHMQNDLMQPPLNEVGYRVARYIWDAALRERLAQSAPPPECKTEEEKTAFAFGWLKAMEAHRLGQSDPMPLFDDWDSRSLYEGDKS